MKKGLVVVKIGGSVLFDRKGFLRKKSTKELLKILFDYPLPKIIIIGCGERLHNLVFKNNLTDKSEIKNGIMVKAEERIKAFFEIYEAVEKNLTEIVDLAPSLLKLRLVHPAHLFIKGSGGSTERHKIVQFNEKIIGKRLDFVTSGGVVLDRNLLVSAISSDTIAAYLAVKYQSLRLILLSDVDGVFASLKKRILLKEVSLTRIDDFQITGGMFNKLRRVRLAVNEKIPTFLLNGNFPQRLREILSTGQTPISTRLMP